MPLTALHLPSSRNLLDPWTSHMLSTSRSRTSPRRIFTETDKLFVHACTDIQRATGVQNRTWHDGSSSGSDLLGELDESWKAK
jgi:hypothetical protein